MQSPVIHRRVAVRRGVVVRGRKSELIAVLDSGDLIEIGAGNPLILKPRHIREPIGLGAVRDHIAVNLIDMKIGLERGGANQDDNLQGNDNRECKGNIPTEPVRLHMRATVSHADTFRRAPIAATRNRLLKNNLAVKDVVPQNNANLRKQLCRDRRRPVRHKHRDCRGRKRRIESE